VCTIVHVKCKECSAEVAPSPNTGRVGKWNKMAAEREGWFFQRDGICYCPKHVPEWVAAWRAKRAAGQPEP
jgi:hypothetical protein